MALTHCFKLEVFFYIRPNLDNIKRATVLICELTLPVEHCRCLQSLLCPAVFRSSFAVLRGPLRSFCDVSGVLCGVSEVLCGPSWSFAVLL